MVEGGKGRQTKAGGGRRGGARRRWGGEHASSVD